MKEERPNGERGFSIVAEVGDKGILKTPLSFDSIAGEKKKIKMFSFISLAI